VVVWGGEREPAPELITGAQARELVSHAFGLVRRKLPDRSVPSIRAELEDAFFGEAHRRALQSELLEGGIVGLRLDVLVMQTSRGDYEALPLAGTAAVRQAVLTGKVDLTEMPAGDPRLPQLRLHEGKPIRYRKEQLDRWLADPEVQQRIAAMLSRPISTAPDVPSVVVVGADGAITTSPDPQAAPPVPAAPTESPAESPDDRPRRHPRGRSGGRGRRPDGVWGLIEDEVFSWLDHEGEPLPGEQVKLEKWIESLLFKHKKDMSERAIRDHVPIYLAKYQIVKAKRLTDK
jgi:hypothetical protein